MPSHSMESRKAATFGSERDHIILETANYYFSMIM